jgi:hypothetical protein
MASIPGRSSNCKQPLSRGAVGHTCGGFNTVK